MIYGPFSLSDATAAEMRFQVWTNTYPVEMKDYLCWMASDDGIVFHGDCAWGDSSGWFTQVLDLSNVTDYGNMLGLSQVWVGFWFYSSPVDTTTEGAYIDNILLQKCVGGGCPTVMLEFPDLYDSRFNISPARESLHTP